LRRKVRKCCLVSPNLLYFCRKDHSLAH
jgi:hypothetical protein